MSVDEGGSAGCDRSGGRNRNAAGGMSAGHDRGGGCIGDAAEVGALVTVGVAVALGMLLR
jgi:hypothetical protein